MAQPTNTRIFPVLVRGTLREDMLTSFRVGARALIDPATAQPFSEAAIAAATAKGSPQYIEADGLDLVLQLEQQRALWLADQVQQGRAGTKFLHDMHAPMWGLSYLPAAGGSGVVTAGGAPGTTFLGSTTLGSSTAAVAADESGRRYQVLYTAAILVGQTSVPLDLLAIDTGEQTNLPAGSVLKWTDNVPLGANPQFSVSSQFTGGVEAETDAQFVRRLERRSRHKAGSGNRAELCAWAEAFSASVDVCFAYSCILYAGTALLVALQKRASNVRGPAGRIPSAGLLAELTAYLVPPGSPIVPDLGLLLVAPPRGTPSNMVLSLSMPVGTDAGWADFQPWPTQTAGAAVTVTAVTDQQHFQIQCAVGLPLGVTRPSLMIWDSATSSFEHLDVQIVLLNSGTTYDVILNTAPALTLTTGIRVSPWTELAPTIADTIQEYFDALGPGEVIDVSSTSTDPRRARAYRFVVPNEEYPYRAGTGITNDLQEALVGSFVDGLLESVSVAVPAIPADPALGPGLLVAGEMMISPL